MLLAVGTVDRYEVARRRRGRARRSVPGGKPVAAPGARREHPDDLVRVRRAEPLRAQHLLPVLGERPDGRIAGRSLPHRIAPPRPRPRRPGSRRAAPSPSGMRTRSTTFCRPAPEPGRQRTRRGRARSCWVREGRADVEHEPVRLRALRSAVDRTAPGASRPAPAGPSARAAAARRHVPAASRAPASGRAPRRSRTAARRSGCRARPRGTGTRPRRTAAAAGVKLDSRHRSSRLAIIGCRLR